MAGTYSTIEHGWWNDPAVSTLDSAEAKLLFVWSFTNAPMASLTGMTVVSERTLMRVTQSASLDVLSDVIDRLADKPLVLYDHDYEVLWCRRRASHSIKNEKQAKGAIRYLTDVPHESPLLAMFWQHYPQLAKLAKAMVKDD